MCFHRMFRHKQPFSNFLVGISVADFPENFFFPGCQSMLFQLCFIPIRHGFCFRRLRSFAHQESQHEKKQRHPAQNDIQAQGTQANGVGAITEEHQ